MVTKKDKQVRYQVGNVIKKGSDLYLVANIHDLRDKYFLINLATGKTFNNSSYDKLSDLV